SPEPPGDGFPKARSNVFDEDALVCLVLLAFRHTQNCVRGSEVRHHAPSPPSIAAEMEEQAAGEGCYPPRLEVELAKEPRFLWRKRKSCFSSLTSGVASNSWLARR